MSQPRVAAPAPSSPDVPVEAPPVPCLNCGATLPGPFCSQCGQRHHDGAPTLRHVWEEFADDYLHLDSKLPRTIATLFTRPGFLTAEYVAGRRARYVGPFKLYVLFSLVFFFCQAVVLPHRIHEPPPTPAQEKPVDLKAVERPGTPFFERVMERLVGKEINHKLPSEIRRTSRHALSAYLPDGMLVLLPLVALFFKLFHRRRYYAEHVVLALHLHAVGFFTFTLLMLSQTRDINLPLLAALAIYVLLSMRRVYRIGWLRSAVEVGALVAVYPFALIALVGSSIVLGFWLGA